jgi:hypothetical protein
MTEISNNKAFDPYMRVHTLARSEEKEGHLDVTVRVQTTALSEWTVSQNFAKHASS